MLGFETIEERIKGMSPYCLRPAVCLNVLKKMHVALSEAALGSAPTARVILACALVSANRWESMTSVHKTFGVQKLTASKECSLSDVQIVNRNGLVKLPPGGDTVPADGLFVSGCSVLIDAWSLTGMSKSILVTSENPRSILDDTGGGLTGGEVVFIKSGKYETLGTPTHTASLVCGLAHGGNFQAQREAPTIVEVEPFNSTKKRQRVELELLEQGGFRADTKAASEIILANYVNNDFAGEALGTLGLGYMDTDKGFSAEDSIPTSGYTCTGIIGSTVPPGIKEHVAIHRSAGINGGAAERTNWVMCPS